MNEYPKYKIGDTIIYEHEIERTIKTTRNYKTIKILYLKQGTITNAHQEKGKRWHYKLSETPVDPSNLSETQKTKNIIDENDIIREIKK